MVIQMIRWRSMDENQLNMVYLIYKLERSAWLRRRTKRWANWRVSSRSEVPDCCASLRMTVVPPTCRTLQQPVVYCCYYLLQLLLYYNTVLFKWKTLKRRRTIPYVNCIYLLPRRMTSALQVWRCLAPHTFGHERTRTVERLHRTVSPYWAVCIRQANTNTTAILCVLITIAYDQWTQFRL